MNLDQYFALHVTSADAKVLYKEYTQHQSQMKALLDDLMTTPDEGVSCQMLYESLSLMLRLQNAHLEAVASLITSAGS